jgi:hypothetical protein
MSFAPASRASMLARSSYEPVASAFGEQNVKQLPCSRNVGSMNPGLILICEVNFKVRPKLKVKALSRVGQRKSIGILPQEHWPPSFWGEEYSI